MEFVGVGVLVVLVGGFVTYVVMKYRAMGPDGQRAHFGLPKGDAVRHMWIGELDSEVTAAGRAAREVVTGVSTWLGAGVDVRPFGVSVALSTQGRLSVVLQTSKDSKRTLVYQRGAIRLRVLGRGIRSVQGGPSLRFTLHSADLNGLPILLHQSAHDYLGEFIDRS